MNVRDILKEMAETKDKYKILAYENQLSFMFAFPVLLLGAVITLYSVTFVGSEAVEAAIFDSIILFAFALIFYLSMKLIKVLYLQENIYSLIFACILIFIHVRMYYMVGPGIWTLSMLLIMISMLHMRRNMLVIMSITVTILGVYTWYYGLTTELGDNYYITQFITFPVLFLIGATVHKIIQKRYDMIVEQYNKTYNSEELMRLTLTSVGDGVIVTNRTGQITFMNPEAGTLTGYSPEDASGREASDIFRLESDGSKESIDLIIEGVMRQGETKEINEGYILVSREAVKRNLEMSIAPICDASDEIIGTVVIFRDVTEKIKEQKAIEYISYHDQLTDLYNRHFYEEESRRLDNERQLPISVIYGDINGLKTINDAFGHSSGDKLIKMTSSIIKTQCRTEDIISRIGGDEFVILLPQTDYEMAKRIEERIKCKLEDTTLLGMPLSASFGTATKTQFSESLNAVMKLAEDIMYQNKTLHNSDKKTNAIFSIMKTMEDNNQLERNHSLRVSKLCEVLGKGLELDQKSLTDLMLAGELHDIGKITIEEEILNKREPLSKVEWDKMMRHPETGYRILASSKEYLEIAESVLMHHERWDGKGYPKGLKEEEISLFARILSIAGSFDAMIRKTPYSDAMTIEEGLVELKMHSGTQFDPELVGIFEKEIVNNLKILDMEGSSKEFTS